LNAFGVLATEQGSVTKGNIQDRVLKSL